MDQHHTVDYLQAQCELRREVAIEEGAATEADFTDFWPGGALNRFESPLDQWILTYARCFWIDGRRAGHEDERASRQGTQERQAQILAAQRGTPESVELVDSDEAGVPRVVQVYPKSAVALDEVRSRGLALAQISDDLEVLVAHGGGDADAELVARAIQEQSYLERLLVWIATSAGVGLPYPEGEPRPALPAFYTTLSPVDFFLVTQAFQRVNAQRLAALEAGRRSDTRPDWSGWWATLSAEMNVPISRLTRDVSLPELLATSAELARSRQEAMDEAKQRAKREAEAA